MHGIFEAFGQEGFDDAIRRADIDADGFHEGDQKAAVIDLEQARSAIFFPAGDAAYDALRLVIADFAADQIGLEVFAGIECYAFGGRNRTSAPRNSSASFMESTPANLKTRVPCDPRRARLRKFLAVVRRDALISAARNVRDGRTARLP